METTINYNLSKPGASDYVDISVLNANMDTVDTQLKNAQSHRESSGLHVTEAQKTKWDGYETVRTLTHVKSGVNHALTGLKGAAGLLSCQFKATAGYNAALDTLTVDGTSYTIKLSSGEKAEDNLFVSGAVVPCIVDTAGKTVNFKAGGGGYKKGDVIAAENVETAANTFSLDSPFFTSTVNITALNIDRDYIYKMAAVSRDIVLVIHQTYNYLLSMTTGTIISQYAHGKGFSNNFYGFTLSEDSKYWYTVYKGKVAKWSVSTLQSIWEYTYSTDKTSSSENVIEKDGVVYVIGNDKFVSLTTDGTLNVSETISSTSGSYDIYKNSWFYNNTILGFSGGYGQKWSASGDLVTSATCTSYDYYQGIGFGYEQYWYDVVKYSSSNTDYKYVAKINVNTGTATGLYSSYIQFSTYNYAVPIGMIDSSTLLAAVMFSGNSDNDIYSGSSISVIKLGIDSGMQNSPAKFPIGGILYSENKIFSGSEYPLLSSGLWFMPYYSSSYFKYNQICRVDNGASGYTVKA